MPEENESHEFRLKSTDEARNYFIEQLNKNELIRVRSKKRFVEF